MERLAGLDDTQWGTLVSKGLDKLDTGPAVLALMNEAATIRSQLAIPSDEIARIPRDPASPEWGALRERLGKPKDPTAYTFDGMNLKPEDEAFYRPLAHELHLSPEAAKQLAVKLAERSTSLTTAQAAQKEAATGAQMAELDRMWGGQKAGNMQLAENAIAALKLPEPVAAALKESAVAMEALRDLGVKLGEARFSGGGGGNGNSRSYTKPQAEGRIAELRSDRGWVDRWLKGGAQEIQELADLHKIVIGGPQA